MAQNSAKISSGTVASVTTIDTSPNSNGLYIASNAISTQSASATNPGMVNTTTQTFAGNKTFSGSITVGSTSLNNTLSGGVIKSYQSTTASITCGDGYWMVAVGTLGAGITVTLPATPANGREIVIKDVNGTCGIPYRITVDGNSKSIDGFGTSFLMASPYESKTFIYTGTIWSII